MYNKKKVELEDAGDFSDDPDQTEEVEPEKTTTTENLVKSLTVNTLQTPFPSVSAMKQTNEKDIQISVTKNKVVKDIENEDDIFDDLLNNDPGSKDKQGQKTNFFQEEKTKYDIQREQNSYDDDAVNDVLDQMKSQENKNKEEAKEKFTTSEKPNKKKLQVEEEEDDPAMQDVLVSSKMHKGVLQQKTNETNKSQTNKASGSIDQNIDYGSKFMNMKINNDNSFFKTPKTTVGFSSMSNANNIDPSNTAFFSSSSNFQSNTNSQAFTPSNNPRGDKEFRSNTYNDDGFGEGGGRFGGRGGSRGGRRGGRGGGNFGNFRDRERDGQGDDGFHRRNNYESGGYYQNRDRGNYYQDNRIHDYDFYKSNEELVELINKNYKNLGKNKVVNLLKEYKADNFSIFEIANDLHVQDIISKHKNFYNDKFINNINKPITQYDEFEADTSKDHYYYICYYNVFSLEDKNKDNDPLKRRRQLMFNLNKNFNYLPILCENKEHLSNNTTINDNCMYAHNEEEIKYHYLFYKLRKCKSLKCEDGKDCYLSHNYYEDLRKIYETSLDDEKIKCLNEILSSKLFSAKCLNFLKDQELPKDFSVDTYKVFPCPNGVSCPVFNKDYHMCYQHHHPMEIRRDPRLFKIKELTPCKYTNINNRWLEPSACPRGVFCQYFHTKNELNYDRRYYRKSIKCIRPNLDENGYCELYEVCYGIHKVNTTVQSKTNSKQNEAIRLKNERIEELEEQLNALKEIALKCSICKNILTFPFFVFKCTKILCKDCSERYAEYECAKCTGKIKDIRALPFKEQRLLSPKNLKKPDEETDKKKKSKDEKNDSKSLKLKK